MYPNTTPASLSPAPSCSPATWCSSYEGIGHVGIYIGGGQFIHASDYGVVVASLYTSYWSACYYGAGRILAN